MMPIFGGCQEDVEFHRYRIFRLVRFFIAQYGINTHYALNIITIYTVKVVYFRIKHR